MSGFVFRNGVAGLGTALDLVLQGRVGVLA